MIYILNSLDRWEKPYGIDTVVDLFSETLDFEKLLRMDMESRIGVFRPSDKLINALLDINYPIIYLGDDERLHPSYRFLPLPEVFFQRDARDVAIDLLGKIIIRRVDGRVLMGKILETEAYYGPADPASRAYRGKKNYNRGMWLPGGHIFVYMVHANWMFNITTDKGEAQAVLIRAVEPLMGLDYMYKRRGRKLRELCNGPGKWTQAFGIVREMNEKPLGGEIVVIESPWRGFDIKYSHRIGVRTDLDEPLRFFIPSKFTSNNKIF